MNVRPGVVKPSTGMDQVNKIKDQIASINSKAGNMQSRKISLQSTGNIFKRFIGIFQAKKEEKVVNKEIAKDKIVLANQGKALKPFVDRIEVQLKEGLEETRDGGVEHKLPAEQLLKLENELKTYRTTITGLLTLIKDKGDKAKLNELLNKVDDLIGAASYQRFKVES